MVHPSILIPLLLIITGCSHILEPITLVPITWASCILTPWVLCHHLHLHHLLGQHLPHHHQQPPLCHLGSNKQQLLHSQQHPFLGNKLHKPHLPPFLLGNSREEPLHQRAQASRQVLPWCLLQVFSLHFHLVLHHLHLPHLQEHQAYYMLHHLLPHLQ